MKIKNNEEVLVNTNVRIGEKIYTALKMYESKNHSIAEIIEATRVSKSTLYRYIYIIE